MKKLFIVVIILLVLQMIIKSNRYEVTSSEDNIVLVNRKGKTLKFYDPTNSMRAGDSIRLFGDYDFNYKPLIINN